MLKLSRREEDFDMFHEMREEKELFNKLPYNMREFLAGFNIFSKQQLISFCCENFYKLRPYEPTQDDIFIVQIISKCIYYGVITLSDMASSHPEGVFVVYLARFLHIVNTQSPRWIQDIIGDQVVYSPGLFPFDAELLLYAYEEYGRKDVIYMLKYIPFEGLRDFYLRLRDKVEEDEKLIGLLKILKSYLNVIGYSIY